MPADVAGVVNMHILRWIEILSLFVLVACLRPGCCGPMIIARAAGLGDDRPLAAAISDDSTRKENPRGAFDPPDP